MAGWPEQRSLVVVEEVEIATIPIIINRFIIMIAAAGALAAQVAWFPKRVFVVGDI